MAFKNHFDTKSAFKNLLSFVELARINKFLKSFFAIALAEAVKQILCFTASASAMALQHILC